MRKMTTEKLSILFGNYIIGFTPQHGIGELMFKTLFKQCTSHFHRRLTATIPKNYTSYLSKLAVISDHSSTQKAIHLAKQYNFQYYETQVDQLYKIPKTITTIPYDPNTEFLLHVAESRIQLIRVSPNNETQTYTTQGNSIYCDFVNSKR